MPREHDTSTNTPRTTQLASTEGMPAPAAPARAEYKRPMLTLLGTVTELTRGGSVSANADGFGSAGGSGVLP